MSLYQALRNLGYTTSGQTCEVLEAFEEHLNTNVDNLSNFIRETNGNNKVGAGQLAEKIVEFIVKTL